MPGRRQEKPQVSGKSSTPFPAAHARCWLAQFESVLDLAVKSVITGSPELRANGVQADPAWHIDMRGDIPTSIATIRHGELGAIHTLGKAAGGHETG